MCVDRVVLHFYNIAFLFFHEYIHRVGVNKLKCMALEAEGKNYRGEHITGTDLHFWGPCKGARSGLHGSALRAAASIRLLAIAPQAQVRT